ncbi:MAG: hypothetical protein H6581_21090 [Bacteroidia bacterium]|nr:hypothetical protein [Bacteroidia bacterium]
MYRQFLQEKFPADEKSNLFKFPALPAVKLGKLLMKETRISQPGDVVAVHFYSSMMSSGYAIFTDTEFFYPGGSFLLEDVKSAQEDGSRVTVHVNHLGSLVTHAFKVGSDEAAHAFRKVFNDLSRFDPQASTTEVAPDYSAYEGKAIDWLLMRDEVMKTIDMLAEKFSDGKISLLEYEEKKEELLSRL